MIRSWRSAMTGATALAGLAGCANMDLAGPPIASLPARAAWWDQPEAVRTAHGKALARALAGRQGATVDWAAEGVQGRVVAGPATRDAAGRLCRDVANSLTEAGETIAVTDRLCLIDGTWLVRP